MQNKQSKKRTFITFQILRENLEVKLRGQNGNLRSNQGQIEANFKEDTKMRGTSLEPIDEAWMKLSR